MVAVTAIYAHHVRHGSGSFEIEPPSLQDMLARRAEVLGRGLPWLVLEDSGKVIGYAYCNWFRPRPAYRFAAENSIYLADGVQGLGLGRALLSELLARAEQAGMRKMIAVIGDTANSSSIGLHLSLGFTHIGTLVATGWKFGRWLDTVLMEKKLGWGDQLPPSNTGV
ncbi:MAG: hypothetical protein RL468_883 [Pseudomonadota bacterium]